MTEQAQQAYTDYEGMMELTESHVPSSCRDSMWNCQDYLTMVLRWTLASHLSRLTMIDAIKKYAGVDFDTKLRQMKKLRALAKEHHVEFEERHTEG